MLHAEQSKFSLMSSKYPTITSTTGYMIYNDSDFEITNDYLEYYNDYNKLIHRAIRENDTCGVFCLCKAIYDNDCSFPWYEPMLVVAIKEGTIGMFCMVYLMYHTWYEERDNEYTISDLSEMCRNSIDGNKKLEILQKIPDYHTFLHFSIKESDDEVEYGEKYFVLYKKMIKSILMFEMFISDRIDMNKFQQDYTRIRL